MFERQLVTQLSGRMHENRRFIQIITGPRQSGKTTSVTQALDSGRTSAKIPYHYISA
ncbi:hypothetical protein FACS189444_6970 [Spirochaetia bacterium]|nr:hypothetical protein FACS189444_6970 [Spirochaetia bacterium]